jgi:hypothetical protein
VEAVIRFMPDTWFDLLARPVAMAAPDAGVYIEIMAPDFRFVFAIGLLVLLALLALRGRRAPRGAARPGLVLAAVLAVAFVPWLATTSNGRYFIACLLLAGPVCVALVWLLPLTKAFRLTLALVLVALQAFAVQQSNPWRAWGLAQWREPPYFGIELPLELRTQPQTYVTLSVISYSLLAPMLPEASRWMSLANAPPAAANTTDSRRAQDFLAAASPGRLMLIAPVVPGFQTSANLPTAEVVTVIGQQLLGHRLAFSQPQPCRFLRSHGIATMALRGADLDKPEKTDAFGFWACELTYLGVDKDPPKEPVPSRYDHVFRMLEANCPRFFAPGQSAAQALPDGEVRNYAQAEMKVYVLDSGAVYYKYYRAFNPVRVGTIGDVLSGKSKVDCTKIHGRSGLPWEREI